jgi:hypothetical protein
VDERLIPINGLIALLRGEGGWPGLLLEQGFERHQFEVPVSTPVGEIRADALLYRCEPNLVLLGECKSGSNVEEEQARRYLAVDERWLRRSGALPPRLRSSTEIAVQMLFVGREEHRASLEASLRHLDISAPLLTVGAERVRLSGASATQGLDDFDEHHGAGLPPGRFPVDHQSADEHLLDVLIPQVIAAQARQEDIVLIETLCDRLLPEWPVLSHAGRGLFLSRVANLLRGLVAGEMRGQFRYEGLKQPHTRGRIVIDVSPARRDPRGRTRAWQAQQTRAATALRRRTAQERAGQLSLDQLADEGGLADE